MHFPDMYVTAFKQGVQVEVYLAALFNSSSRIELGRTRSTPYLLRLVHSNVVGT